MVEPRTTINFARYRSKLLGLAALGSFISASWAAAHPFTNHTWIWSLGFIELNFYTFPIVLLTWGAFFLTFIPKVILERRLDIRAPLRIEFVCVALAWCFQFVATVLETVANPYGTIWSNWGFINLTSTTSLMALTTYLVLPILPDMCRVVMLIAQPNRRTHNTPYEEPLLPAYSSHSGEIPEVRVFDESGIDLEVPIMFDAGLRNHSDRDEARIGGYSHFEDDLERGATTNGRPT
ncbi:unnamed protein product [Rhizoctonia solani]|uniref:Uncharacterized protein n=1 Tax=Rhizoctonia solani TaxID=456999 RepID=A0A8H3DRG6_9AGAM|nr:unnamed protein product [Rhizoctonia solani]